MRTPEERMNLATRAIARELHAIASEDVPDSVDLWPALQARMASVRSTGQRRATTSTRALAFGVVAVGLALALVGGPSGAVDQVSKVVRVGQDPHHPQSYVRGTIEQVQAVINFPIPTPEWLPAPLVLREASDSPPPHAHPPGEELQGVLLSYGPADGREGSVLLYIWQGEGGGYEVAPWVVQEVQVNDRPATYAHGIWSDFRSQKWDESADFAVLAWQEDRFTYILRHSGLGLSRDDAIRIAESLR
ncbi:MAG: hypothetical protein GEU73_16055 [Chloroflexi bacterium]|nr:hypothetical protein [Chloroflexota bacterium]